VGQALFPAQTHVHFALAQTALPGEKPEQGKNRALKDALARQTTILLVTTTGAGPHENLIGLKAGKASKDQRAGYPKPDGFRFGTFV